MKIDKQEKKWKNRKKFKEVEKILNEEFKNVQPSIGFNNRYWARKKQLLKEMYNIDWLSPRELNPHITFD